MQQTCYIYAFKTTPNGRTRELECAQIVKTMERST